MLGVVIAVNARRRILLVEVEAGSCSLLTDCEDQPRPGTVLEGLLDRKGIETLRNINTGRVFSGRVQFTRLPKRTALLQLVGEAQPA
ncbi:MAG: hypothetical protein LDL26_04690 [Caenispirillum bisanense]|uniref:Uncharacterized protein n=1 Tax=Caenispirillum bisanense TaxID=414052 RepID=A0A286GDV1_9PROT|nr:hypothetical protein [Caenispirillum bisanense]MCA1940273.1 hypothetical protein [Caenispirillum bisanense]MCA1972698.1 hypothetical protein [Caenispirillum sp.]SOD93705.1 hypothetical protein SAMN05421508_103161 [Caenispirillum bisanense]